MANSPAPKTVIDFSPIDQKVSSLLQQMTLEEKLGQLTQFSDGGPTGPETFKTNQSEWVAQGKLGSVLNMSGAEKTNALQRIALEKSRLKIPLLFGLDIIHGYRTVYPIPLAMSTTWDPQMVEQCARMAAVEGTSEGLRWTFSPMVDIARDARWGRITEGSGEDPFLGAAMAEAWVHGYQGQNLAAPTALVACAKHFAAYGAAEGGRDYNAAEMSERELREIYLPPFKAALGAGAGTFMSGFNTINGTPVSAHRHLLTDILRTEWGFKGFVVSDWTAIEELMPHGIALNGADAARKALLAGVDMDMCSKLYATHLPNLVERGKLNIEVIDEAVARVLRIKFALGLFEQPYTDETLASNVMLTPEHLTLARQAAESSFVLLKNASYRGQPVLPLRPDQNIALIGALADSKEDMFGSWVLRGDPKDVVTLHATLAEKIGENLRFISGVSPKAKFDEDFENAILAAKQADVIVMALGESSRMAGEAASRSRLDLPGRQSQLLQEIVMTGKPVVLVLFNGRPLTLPWEAENVTAILEAWYPGVQAGPALVRTLYGENNPSGKLTTSFPRFVGQLPMYYNHLNTGRPNFGKQIGNAYITGYIDETDTPLYPFGWGLSYTTFSISKTCLNTANIRAEQLNSGANILVTATVKNTGPCTGAEVVQLYIQHRGTSIARPVRELKAFSKISLAPGESCQVEFTLSKKELAFWSAELQWQVEPCELTVWIASHSKGGEPEKINIE